MTHLLRAGDLIGLPVVSIATGEDLAEVRDVIYDGSEHRLLGFTLNKRGMFAGRLKEVLTAESVTGIGADALMIDDTTAIDEAAADEESLRHLKAAKPVVGNRVVSSDGNALGEVVGVVLSTGRRPEAVGYEVSAPDLDGTAFVPISDQMALSGDNLLVPVESTEFIRNDLAGFGAAVTEYRERMMNASPVTERPTDEGGPQCSIPSPRRTSARWLPETRPTTSARSVASSSTRVLTGSKRCTSPVEERTPTSSSGVGFASVATR